jgi:hypothetical protein
MINIILQIYEYQYEQIELDLNPWRLNDEASVLPMIRPFVEIIKIILKIMINIILQIYKYQH